MDGLGLVSGLLKPVFSFLAGDCNFQGSYGSTGGSIRAQKERTFARHGTKIKRLQPFGC